jgi:hypothetical protein
LNDPTSRPRAIFTTRRYVEIPSPGPSRLSPITRDPTNDVITLNDSAVEIEQRRIALIRTHCKHEREARRLTRCSHAVTHRVSAETLSGWRLAVHAPASVARQLLVCGNDGGISNVARKRVARSGGIGRAV